MLVSVENREKRQNKINSQCMTGTSSCQDVAPWLVIQLQLVTNLLLLCVMKLTYVEKVLFFKVQYMIKHTIYCKSSEEGG